MREQIAAAAAFLLLAAAAAWIGSAATGSAPPLTVQDLPPRPPAPLSPPESLAAFDLADNLAIAPAAAEPAVQAPVMAVFDEDARLWVVEMRSYMPDVKARGEDLPTNRISVLEDKDGDGVYETSRVFLDNLMLPRAVAPCFGGALVLEPPALYFCKDTDGDGLADVKIRLLDGFGGLESPEHAGNGLLRGIDNWYHFSQHNVEIRFDGTKIITRPTPTQGQWGITQDDWGRLYYTPNPSPLLMDMFPKHLAPRNPHTGSVAGMGELISASSEVWPAHATLGVNRGYMKNVLRDDGRLANCTAACGPLILRSPGLGPAFRDNAFVCEPAGNLVKRLILREKDGLPDAVNAYDRREFLTSTDERFRPVWAFTGPDASLYLCDMYRGVIQHRLFLTEYLEKHIKSHKLETPINMGRIWRISPRTSASHTPPPRLSTCSDAQLVDLLASNQGWLRDTAQRLLVERRTVAAAPALREMLSHASDWRASLHALWTLEGLGILTAADVQSASKSPEPALVSAALQCARSLAAPPTIDAATHPSRAVRITAAACDPSLDPARAAALLTRYAPDRFERAAILSNIAGKELDVLRATLNASADPPPKDLRRVISELASCAVRSGPPARTDLANLAAASKPGAAALLMESFESAMRLDNPQPKPLALSAEPLDWTRAAAAETPLHARMATITLYMDWPGRPPVRRTLAVRPLTPSEQDLFTRGSTLFSKCAACHLDSGLGSPGQGASLVAGKIATGRPETAIRVLLSGLEGEYPFGEITYRGSMPPAGFATDSDVAAVLTYVRRSWDNTADPVTPEMVTKVRAQNSDRSKPWTREELGVPIK